MKIFLISIFALVAGIIAGFGIKDAYAFHSTPITNQHSYCDPSECWWWERVPDGGANWSTKFGENRLAIAWNEGWCGNIDSSCSPNHMHWVWNGNDPQWHQEWARWSFAGESEDESITKIWVFIPDINATTQMSVYDYGSSYWIGGFSIDQLSYSDEWVYGAEHEANGSNSLRYVELRGDTWEDRGTTKIGFDEVQFNYHH